MRRPCCLSLISACPVVPLHCYDGTQLSVLTRKACVLPQLASSLFSHVIFPIHLKPTQSLHCASSVVVLSSPPLISPPLSHASLTHQPVTCKTLFHHASILSLCRTQAISLRLSHACHRSRALLLCTFLLVLSFYLLPATTRYVFLSLYGTHLQLKNIKPNKSFSLSRQPIFFLLFRININDETCVPHPTTLSLLTLSATLSFVRAHFPSFHAPCPLSFLYYTCEEKYTHTHTHTHTPA